jgi:membrane protein
VPETDIAWKNVWLGAFATAVLFAIGKLLIGLYLGKARVGSAYGAAGSLVVLIVWIYYSAQIFFFGAEFTRVYTQSAQEGTVAVEQREEPAPPAPVAVPTRQPPGRKLTLAGSFSAGLLLGMRFWKRNGKVAR